MAKGDEDERIELDPYQCIVKKNQKYANDCYEVYLAKHGATHLSDNFRNFPNLEVVWFNGNRLSRIEHLENNFRLREVFIQDNMLVSLSGLSPKKQPFLRVLLASNNQLRNLEKQLPLLASFSFMKKLDLFGNPCAEEPDYRLKTLYQVPQVEILDRHTVSRAERDKADEIIPNLDKVAGAKPERVRKKGPQLSIVEKDCFNEARAIKARRAQAADRSLEFSLTQAISADTKAPTAHMFRTNAEHWSHPSVKVRHERSQPTPWERGELAKQIKKVAEKDAVNQADLTALATRLASEGLRDCGRRLGSADVLVSLAKRQASSAPKSTTLPPAAPAAAAGAKQGGKGAPAAAPQQNSEEALQAVLQSADATCPIGVVADWLATLEWPRQEDDHLDGDITRLYDAAKRAELGGAKEDPWPGLHTALRLEGAKTLKHEVSLGPPVRVIKRCQLRSDSFHQSMLLPSREVDESTGRLSIKVAHRKQQTQICSLGREG
mmetsp:Transcript_19784/g.35882  ORF Transcript_19784/g.35882 Transcript_19784/m.35882 type:complete len:492 (+) Transcript_19784:105-1580(+)